MNKVNMNMNMNMNIVFIKIEYFEYESTYSYSYSIFIFYWIPMSDYNQGFTGVLFVNKFKSANLFSVDYSFSQPEFLIV